MAIVQVRNLTKKYGELTAVKGISFSIKRGEIFGFLGPNGAGKTTTINVLVGLARPTEGEIKINGLDVRKDLKKVQSLLGVVAEENNLYPELSGFENLCFCASLYGIRRGERERRAARLLQQFNLSEAGERPFRTYSRGMKRKLTISAALIHDPELIFLDEPTIGIDVESARQIRQLIVDLKKQGKTIFLTTHDLREAEFLCERLALIVQGEIIKIAEIDEFIGQTSHKPRVKLVLEGEADLAAVLEFMEHRGIVVHEMSEIRPSLEEAFLQVTKHARRD